MNITKEDKVLKVRCEKDLLFLLDTSIKKTLTVTLR